MRPNIAPLYAVFATFILLFATLSIIEPSTTGYITLQQSQSISEKIDLVTDLSTSFIWSQSYIGNATSVRLSGTYTQGTNAIVYFLVNNSRIKVLDTTKVESNQISQNSVENSTTIGVPRSNLSLSVSGGGQKEKNAIFELKPYLNQIHSADYLCTHWTINQTNLCYGSDDCCQLLELESSNSWNESLYLTQGRFETADSFKVQAQTVFANYSLDPNNPFSDIRYSSVEESSITFKDQLFRFNKVCDETCILDPNLNLSHLLQVEIVSGKINLTTLDYEILQEINVSQNPPVQTRVLENITLYENESTSINLSNYFTDLDNDPLKFRVNSLDEIAISVTNNALSINPSRNYTGSASFYLEVTDGFYTIASNLVSINIIKPPATQDEVNVTINKTRSRIVINQPVKWKQHIKATNAIINLSLNVTSAITNITIKDPETNESLNENKIKVRDGEEIKNLTTFKAQKRIEQIQDIKEDISQKRQTTLEESPTATDVLSDLNQQLLALENEQNQLTGFAVADVGDGIITRLINWIFDPAVTGYAILDPEVSLEENISITVEEIIEEVIVEYETEAPISTEEYTSKGKQIVISSDTHYEDILAYTFLDNVPADTIELFHKINGSNQKVDFDPFDLDNDTLVDYIEWVVPHLSNQTYELVLTVLTLHSHAIVDQNWTIDFLTSGTANLTITPINDTPFLDADNISPDHIEFLDLQCGNESVNITRIYNQSTFTNIQVNDYSCNNMTSTMINKWLVAATHAIEFTFGNQTGYAQNNPDSDAPDNYSFKVWQGSFNSITTTLQDWTIECDTDPLNDAHDASSGYNCSIDVGDSTNPTFCAAEGNIFLGFGVGDENEGTYGNFFVSCANQNTCEGESAFNTDPVTGLYLYNIDWDANEGHCTCNSYNWTGSLCCGDDAAEGGPYEHNETTCSDGSDNDCDGRIDGNETFCNVVPTDFPSITINASNVSNTTTEQLSCFFTCFDNNSENALTYNVSWYNNYSIQHTRTNVSCINGTLNQENLSFTNTTKGEEWTCSVRLHDQMLVSNWVNSTRLTIANTKPQTPEMLLPVNLGAYVNVSQVLFVCEDVDPDNHTFEIYINGTYNLSTNSNLTYWNISDGYYNLTINCFDGDNHSENRSIFFTQDSRITIPEFVYPLDNMNISSNMIDLNATADANTTITFYWIVNNTLNSTTTDANTTLNASDGFYNVTVNANAGFLLNGSDSIFIWLDTIEPSFTQNQTNATNTGINGNVTFQMTFVDRGAGNRFTIFSWNGSGTWDNNSNVSLYTNSDAVLFNKTSHLPRGETIGYRWYVNDSAGNWNSTSLVTYTVANTPPTMDVPLINSTDILNRSNGTLYCWNQSISDADNDSFSTYFRWYNNSQLMDGQNQVHLGPGNFSKDDSIICEIIPNDGLENGTIHNSTNLTIGNTAPDQPTVIVTQNPSNVTDIHCNVTIGQDVDADELNFTFYWYRNDVLTYTQGPSTANSSELSLTNTSFLDNWNCTVIPSDSDDSGLAASTNVTIQNELPVAILGSPTNITVNSNATLNGSNSFDYNNDTDKLTFTWNFGDGQSQQGVNLTTTNHNYTSTGTFTVVLTVSDGVNSDSTSTQVIVTQENTAGNDAPTAHAGLDQISFLNSSNTTSITFNGSVSIDPDGDTLTYAWSNGASGVTPEFNYSSPGVYDVTLLVSDGILSDSDDVTIIIGPYNSTENDKPLAYAGPDQIVTLNGSNHSIVYFDGSGSIDADGDPLTYTWSNGLTGPTPYINYTQAGVYTISLTVSDGSLTDSDYITIQVNPYDNPGINDQPVANAGPDVTYSMNESNTTTVYFDGSLSYDPDNNPLTYVWSNGLTNVTNHSVYTVPGVYTVSLTVSDGNLSDNDYLLVQINPYDHPGINDQPVANAGPDLTYTLDRNNQTTIYLDASLSYDPDNNPLTYTWSNGLTGITNSTVLTEPGIHTMELSVTDGNLSDTDQVRIQVNPYNNPGINDPPVANAGPDVFYTVNASNQTTINLDGSASFDPDGDELSYFWTNPTIGSLIGKYVSAIINASATYAILLTVNDSEFVDTDEVYISVNDSSSIDVYSNVSNSTIINSNVTNMTVSDATIIDNCIVSGTVEYGGDIYESPRCFDYITAFCGDFSCNRDETCSSCPGDCGACPSTASTDTGATKSSAPGVVSITLGENIPYHLRLLKRAFSSFYIENLRHVFKIESVHEGHITASLRPAGIYFDVPLGHIKYIDTNNDGFAEFSVELLVLEGSFVEIELLYITEKIPISVDTTPSPDPIELNQTIDQLAPLEEIDTDESRIRSIFESSLDAIKSNWIWAIFLVVVIILGVYYSRHIVIYSRKYAGSDRWARKVVEEEQLLKSIKHKLLQIKDTAQEVDQADHEVNAGLLNKLKSSISIEKSYADSFSNLYKSILEVENRLTTQILNLKTEKTKQVQKNIVVCIKHLKSSIRNQDLKHAREQLHSLTIFVKKAPATFYSTIFELLQDIFQASQSPERKRRKIYGKVEKQILREKDIERNYATKYQNLRNKSLVAADTFYQKINDQSNKIKEVHEGFKRQLFGLTKRDETKKLDSIHLEKEEQSALRYDQQKERSKILQKIKLLQVHEEKIISKLQNKIQKVRDGSITKHKKEIRTQPTFETIPRKKEPVQRITLFQKIKQVKIKERETISELQQELEWLKQQQGVVKEDVILKPAKGVKESPDNPYSDKQKILQKIRYLQNHEQKIIEKLHRKVSRLEQKTPLIEKSQEISTIQSQIKESNATHDQRVQTYTKILQLKNREKEIFHKNVRLLEIGKKGDRFVNLIAQGTQRETLKILNEIERATKKGMGFTKESLAQIKSELLSLTRKIRSPKAKVPDKEKITTLNKVIKAEERTKTHINKLKLQENKAREMILRECISDIERALIDSNNKSHLFAQVSSKVSKLSPGQKIKLYQKLRELNEKKN